MSGQDLANLEQAKRNAARARARVIGTSAALQDRLKPANLAAEAKNKVRDKACAVSSKASDAVSKRPVAVSAAAGVAALILFRKPIGKLRSVLFGRRKDRPISDASNDRDGIIRAGEPPKPSVMPKIKRAVSDANAATLNALSKE